VKDMLGNELAQGDAVLCKYGNEWVSGLIVKIQNGGLALGIGNATQKNPQAQVTSDMVVLQVTVPLGGYPGQPQPFIAKLDTKARTEALVESAIKM
jgi:hypothetical protein